MNTLWVQVAHFQNPAQLQTALGLTSLPSFHALDAQIKIPGWGHSVPESNRLQEDSFASPQPQNHYDTITAPCQAFLELN
jgi:hypothetical protein